MTLFEIRLELSSGEQVSIGYRSIVEALTDPYLKALYDGGRVSRSSVHYGDSGTRITAGPIDTWWRICNQLARNAPTILRQLV